jgi:hypothetical protein
MQRLTIRAEPGHLIVEFSPTYRLRGVLLYTLGVAALIVEMVITYPHHRDGFVPFDGDFRDPRIGTNQRNPKGGGRQPFFRPAVLFFASGRACALQLSVR